MPGGIPVLTISDKNVAFGVVTTGVPTILAGMKKLPLATMKVSFVAPHPFMGIPPKPIHPPNPIMMNCSKTVLAGPAKMGVAKIGSIDMCMHPMLGPGVLNVLVGL